MRTRTASGDPIWRAAAQLSRDQVAEDCGCGAKLPGAQLQTVVDAAHAACGRGPAEPADCATFMVGREPALLTVDFSPVVTQDTRRAGAIAVAHALSDVYATGGTPVTAGAILMIGTDVELAAAADILAGMFRAAQDEGCEITTGHTVVGAETMAGLAVVGVPGAVPLGKAGAQPGDRILLSKPVGVGMILRAHRYEEIGDEALEPALRSMQTSNRKASVSAVAAGVHAATDVTGFGLLGHLAEMLASGGLGAVVRINEVPLVPGVAALPDTFTRSRRMEENLAYGDALVPIASRRSRRALAPLLDPQTSGGLMIAAPPHAAGALMRAGYRDIGSVNRDDRIEVL